MGVRNKWALWMVFFAAWACGSGHQIEDEGPWKLTPSQIEWFQKFHGNPAERAAEGVPKLLLGENLPPPRQNKANDLSWLEGIYLPSTNSSVVSPACARDVEAILKPLENVALMGAITQKWHFWPILLPDSWGKVPDGLIYGNYLLWGMMEECTGLDVNEDIGWPFNYNVSFKGRYCLVSTARTIPDGSRESASASALRMGAARVGVAMTYPAVPPLFQYGTCIPDSCTKEDMEASLNERLSVAGKEVRYLDCKTEDEVVEFDAGDIAYIVVLSILGALLVAGALAEFIMSQTDTQHLRKGPLKYLLVFSAYTNFNKIFHISTKENPSVISCLHGIRVLSMTWVVWGHGYMFLVGVTKNIIGAKLLVDEVIEQIIGNATFSVDSFFFMSGLLVAYGVLREHERSGRVNWIMFYVHRFIRLAPPIALTAGAMATIAKFALVGPHGPSIERSIVDNCKSYWWADTLFVGNLLEQGKMCLPQCWYTGVDTQIYIILPFIFIPLLWKPKIGIPWMAIMTLVSFVIPTVIFAVYNVAPALFFAKPEEQPTEFVDTYGKPWCRANAYLIGCWAGYLLYKVSGKKIKLTWWQALLGWVLAALIGCLVIFGVANYNTTDDPDLMPPEVSIIYGGFSRGAWALALLWVVFACHTGYGGPINTFLSHPSWQPLSRLTYSMYLTTIPVQLIYSGAVFMPVYLDHLNKIVETCGYLFIGGLLAVLLSLMTEGPVLGLEKLLIRRPGRGVEQQKTE
ncbi:nose resistant to fluoxetine protein 6-like [Penaeus japonicus]|uniref:nose resistant to fluoxetine protein 6-like n=1 Tax=Penaeus japonicus TaxID=27405 RepID=UPI001C70D5EC|nr:nose resistant to fluoxetine protein 6-like [Penaeus japonicus]